MYRLLRRAHVALARRRSIRSYLCRCDPFHARPDRKTRAHAVLTTGCAGFPQHHAVSRHVAFSRLESRRLAAAPAGDQVIRWRPRRAAGARHARGSGRLSRRHPGLPNLRLRVSPVDRRGSLSICSSRSGWRRSRPVFRAGPRLSPLPSTAGRRFPRLACGESLHRNQALPTSAGRPLLPGRPAAAREGPVRGVFDVAGPTTLSRAACPRGEAAGGVTEASRTPACRTFVTSRQS
jgi:hypothetical protein